MAEQTALMKEVLDRRSFFKLMGASIALAGLDGCAFRPPDETIVPYDRQPEQLIPGRPAYYATAMTLQGLALGLIVESHEGRPTKIEGNRDHPASLGATDAFAQASILTLYDPERSRTVMHHGQISTWNAFVSELRNSLAPLRSRQGAGLHILTETLSSPTLTAQLSALLKSYPNASWHQYEPTGRDEVREGARLAFGEYADTIYRFDKADVVLALDSDFLASGPASVRHARDFMSRRRLEAGRSEMNRLYSVHCMPSPTSATADHRLPRKPSEIEALAFAVAQALGVPGVSSTGTSADSAWIDVAVRDLLAHRGSGIVIAGEQQSALVHALAHAMNQHLGNAGSTVSYIEPVQVAPLKQTESLRQLVAAMDGGEVEVLLILGGNPVYSAPADFHFGESLSKAPLRAHLGLYDDETSAACNWHIPETHYLESWSDARAFDGTASVVQPLIAPLYDGKSPHELIAVLGGDGERTSYDLVREHWRGKIGIAESTDGFDRAWHDALHAGIVPGTQSPAKAVSVKAASYISPLRTASEGPLEIVFRPDPTIFDGCFANNAWLQELPKPLTKLTWDNAAMLSPATARRLGLSNGLTNTGGEHGDSQVDVVELRFRNQKLRAPVWIVPGHADDSVTVHLGYGRSRAGSVGGNAKKVVGFNAGLLRSSTALWSSSDL